MLHRKAFVELYNEMVGGVSSLVSDFKQTPRWRFIRRATMAGAAAFGYNFVQRAEKLIKKADAQVINKRRG